MKYFLNSCYTSTYDFANIRAQDLDLVSDYVKPDFFASYMFC